MTKKAKRAIIEGYLAAEKPYEVCVHTTMGSYMEFLRLERNIMFEDNARMVCDEYAKTFKPTDTIKAICVRRDREVVYEVEL